MVIEVGRGRRVVVDGAVDAEALARVLDVLGSAMIPVPTGIRVWIAAGHTDMRRGMNGLSLLVQEGLKRDPFAGDLYVFRGRRGDLLKCLWYDGLGLSLYSKRLDRGRFVWPSTAGDSVSISRGTARLSARGNRLAAPAADLATEPSG